MRNDNQEEENISLACRIENSKTFTNVLSCLCPSIRKELPMYVEATSQSIVFIVSGKSKSTQSRATLQSAIFDEYFCGSNSDDDGSVQFVVDINTVLDCLQLFGSSSENTTLTMSFNTTEAMFKLELEESGVLTTCDIVTVYDDDFEELHSGIYSAFRNTPEEVQIIVKSEILREGIQELMDVSGAISVVIEVSKERGEEGLRLSAEGSIGTCFVGEYLDFNRTYKLFIY